MLGRKKTSGERERERIEHAELSRRLRAGEDVSVVTRDAGVLRDIADYLTALRDLARSSYQPAPAPEPPVCEKHDWPAPSERANGRPHPPESMCPHCLEGARAKPAGPTVWVDSPPRKETPKKLDEAWDKHVEQLRASGVVLPGSQAEADAVRRSDDLRAQELAYGGGSKPAYASWNGMRVMHVRRPKRRSSFYTDDRGQIIVRS